MSVWDQAQRFRRDVKREAEIAAALAERQMNSPHAIEWTKQALATADMSLPPKPPTPITKQEP